MHGGFQAALAIPEGLNNNYSPDIVHHKTLKVWHPCQQHWLNVSSWQVRQKQLQRL